MVKRSMNSHKLFFDKIVIKIINGSLRWLLEAAMEVLRELQKSKIKVSC
jgi:hypothetical protein|tara:strand:+ start:1223 stop:1369 length:147 start_codon:yes stop_codon:yes gene_type:complete